MIAKIFKASLRVVEVMEAMAIIKGAKLTIVLHLLVEPIIFTTPIPMTTTKTTKILATNVARLATIAENVLTLRQKTSCYLQRFYASDR